MLPYQNLSLEDMPGEVWKDIPGWEGCYQASTEGRIKSLARINFQGKRFKERILRQTFRGKDYLYVRFYRNGTSFPYQVARVVSATFLPNPDNKPTVDHISTDKSDNRVENLRWATHHENMMNPITRAHRSETFRKKYPPKIKRADGRFSPIVAINLTSKVVRYYPSIKETLCDGFKPGPVSSVCRKQRNSLFGWKFFYADDPELTTYLTNLPESLER